VLVMTIQVLAEAVEVLAVSVHSVGRVCRGVSSECP
jgi:hypothetical protein